MSLFHADTTDWICKCLSGHLITWDRANGHPYIQHDHELGFKKVPGNDLKSYKSPPGCAAVNRDCCIKSDINSRSYIRCSL